MTSTNGVFRSEVCQALLKAKIQDWGSGMMDMVGPSHVQERISGIAAFYHATARLITA